VGSVRSVFVKVNSDPEYRAEYLRDPVGTLRKEGIKLTTNDEKQLMELTQILKKHLPELGELPRGYDALLDEVEGKHSPRKSGDPGPLIF
jgi:hypothetical protein